MPEPKRRPNSTAPGAQPCGEGRPLPPVQEYGRRGSGSYPVLTMLPKPMTLRRLGSLLAAATVGAIATSTTPARAGVSTAAWMTANVFCRGLNAGLSINDATRVAFRDNWPMWSAEMVDPAFRQFLVAEAMQQCPDLMRQNAAPP